MEKYTEEQVNEMMEEREAAEAQRIADEFQVNPKILELWGGDTPESKRALASLISQDITKATDKAREGETQEQPGETLEDRQRREILGSEPYKPTMEELSSWSVEQYKRWRDLGGRETASEGPEEGQQSEEERAAEIERLGGLSMAEYETEFNAREK